MGKTSRVRADNGGENVAVGDYMVWFQGENRGSFLTGPSTRNTQIERLWRDVEGSVVADNNYGVEIYLQVRLIQDDLQ